MARARLRPLPGAPALVLDPGRPEDRALIVADLHLGLGGNPRWAEGPEEGAPSRLLRALLDAARAAGARRILIAGDVKHPIVGTPPPLRPIVFDFFAGLLSAGLRPEVILGNHDVGLVPYLPREVAVHPASGHLESGVGIFHGHRWPSEEVRDAERLVVGHLHPGYRFAPTAVERDAKRRCWVRATFPEAPASPTPRRGAAPRRFRAREAIVLPAFHPLAGTEALNRSVPSRGRSFLFLRLLARGSGRLYLLDGTDLGALIVPAAEPPTRSPWKAPPVPRSERGSASRGRAGRGARAPTRSPPR